MVLNCGKATFNPPVRRMNIARNAFEHDSGNQSQLGTGRINPGNWLCADTRIISVNRFHHLFQIEGTGKIGNLLEFPVI
jgi:hypothetical protein